MNQFARAYRLDAAQSAFLELQLEQLKVQTQEIKYPALKGRLFVPTSNEIDPGAEAVAYEQGDGIGRAKIMADHAEDSPNIDDFSEKFSRPVREIAAHYNFTRKEMLSAAMTNRPLTTKRAARVRRAIEHVIDDVAAVGAPSFGIPTGFTNDANVPQQAAAATWAASTPAVIVAQIGDALSRIIAATEDTEHGNTIVIPPDSLSLIATTQNSAASDKTILQFILENFPTLVAVESWNRLQTAGAGSTRRMVTYDRSPTQLEQDIPEEFTTLEPEVRPRKTKVESVAQTAGMVWYKPLSADYLDTI